MLHGILAGPIAPTVDQRAAMDMPALVIGHQVDRIHPFHDAEQLARRLPEAVWSRPTRSSSCGSTPSGSPARSPSSSTRPGRSRLETGPPGGLSPGVPALTRRSPGRRFRFRSDSWRLAASRRSLAPRDGRVGRRGLSTWRAAATRCAEPVHGQLAVADL